MVLVDEFVCDLCAEDWVEPDWNDYPHGVDCSICGFQVYEGWCEAVKGNDGNGFCSDCSIIGSMSLEDRYEDQ